MHWFCQKDDDHNHIHHIDPPRLSTNELTWPSKTPKSERRCSGSPSATSATCASSIRTRHPCIAAAPKRGPPS